MSRVGIFAGVFDPIHPGHTFFLEKAANDKKLDKVYVLIERHPKYKSHVASYEDRREMVRLSLQKIPAAEIYEGKDEYFPITSNLPDIKKTNPGSQFFLLLGEDVAAHIGSWDDSKGALDDVELIIAKRKKGEPFAEASSLKIRNSLKNDELVELDPGVAEYIKHNQLYIGI